MWPFPAFDTGRELRSFFPYLIILLRYYMLVSLLFACPAG